MIQPIRGRCQPLGYFLRGADQFARARRVNGIKRFLMGIVFSVYERTVASIQRSVVDAPSASAMRQFLTHKSLTRALTGLLDWKVQQLIRRALGVSRNRQQPIILVIDSTFKSTLSRLARHLFHTGGSKTSASHIFVYGLLLFPDGSRLPVRPRQKKRGRGRPSQTDLAGEIVRQMAEPLHGQNVVVLADGFFFSRKLLKAIRESGFHYVLASHKQSVLTTGQRLDDVGAVALRHSTRITVPSQPGRSERCFSVALRHVRLRCGGHQAVLFSRPYRKRVAKTKILVSDLVEASAIRLARLYAMRWQIELFFRDMKHYLGLDQYRAMTGAGPENFVLLATLAHVFLHWHGSETPRRGTTLECIRALSQAITRENLTAIERSVSTRHGRKQLRAYVGWPRTTSAHGPCNGQSHRSRQRTAS